jgi:hypothetical protein
MPKYYIFLALYLTAMLIFYGAYRYTPLKIRNKKILQNEISTGNIDSKLILNFIFSIALLLSFENYISIVILYFYWRRKELFSKKVYLKIAVGFLVVLISYDPKSREGFKIIVQNILVIYIVFSILLK